MIDLTPSDAATATDMALLHGLLQRSESGSLIHCPLMLSPTPIAEADLTRLQCLTEPFSLLAHRVANDLEFLDQQLRQAAAADDYTRFLLELALEEQREQHFRFSITRSDYFLTQPGPDGAGGLRQVELNTIAASYVGLAGRMPGFHRTWSGLCREDWAVVPNDPVAGIADAFVEVMAAYGVPQAKVLFVVQPGERNIFDQRLLEMALAERGIGVVRATLEEIGQRGRLRDGELVLDGRIMAVTYFRAGYRPDELEGDEARQARRLIARSSTVSVPDLATHLAGTKKVQQVLTDPRQLRRFIEDNYATRVERAFARIHALDETVEQEGRTLPAREAAIAHPERFVLKPQREGGGFNLYGEDIRRRLQSSSAREQQAYILMERLHPVVRQAWGLRNGQFWQGEVVSEIGHFGVLFASGPKVHLNQAVGYLVRTKHHDVDEGGISAGFGHLDGLARVEE